MILIYNIQRATINDHAEITELHGYLFDGSSKDMPSLLQGDWWVLKHNFEAIVGFCAMKPSEWYYNTTYLSRVGIAVDHQGKGLHRSLIRVRERLCRQRSIPWVVTDTAPDNYASSNSLIRSGYRLFEPWHPWADNKLSLYWGKRL